MKGCEKDNFLYFVENIGASPNNNDMEKKELEAALEMAASNFLAIKKKGRKYKQRRVPIYIRRNLWTPYYLTVGEHEERYISIITPPENDTGKVCFRTFEILRE